MFEDDGADGVRGEDGEVFDRKWPGEQVGKSVDGVGQQCDGLKEESSPAKMEGDAGVEQGDEQRAVPGGNDAEDTEHHDGDKGCDGSRQTTSLLSKTQRQTQIDVYSERRSQ